MPTSAATVGRRACLRCEPRTLNCRHDLRSCHRTRGPRAGADPLQDFHARADRLRPRAQHPDRPHGARVAGGVAGDEQGRARCDHQGGAPARVQNRAGLQMGPEELLLPGLAEELPDLAIRSADLPRRRGGDRAARVGAQRDGGAQEDPAHAHSPRGGCRQTQPRCDRLPRGLQPRGHAADGDRIRSGDAHGRGGVCVSHVAAGDDDLRRHLGLRHGEGAAPLRRQHLHPSGGRDEARHEGGAEEP